MKKRPPFNVGAFFIEFRKKDQLGYFVSGPQKTFELAQKERDRLIAAGATEALIKKKD